MLINQNVHYSALENEFKIKMAKLSFSYVASTMGILIYVYQFINQSNAFLWILCTVYPFFFMTMVFSYWMLLICLIRQNLRFINECVTKLHETHKLFRINTEFYSHDLRMKRNHEFYNLIVKLKRIYGIIFDTTSLVNELIGIPVCLFLIIVVMGNISAGYKIFLSVKGDIEFERVVGKNLLQIKMLILCQKNVVVYVNFFQFQYM